MFVPVAWVSYKEETPARGYWDQALIEDLLTESLWGFFPQVTLRHQEGLGGLDGDGAIVVLPARAQADCLPKLNEDLSALQWVLLVLTGDEESVFPFEEISHPRLRVWVMSARPQRHRGARFLGSGYQPVFRSLRGRPVPARTKDWFFAGQVTHQRREMCVEELLGLSEPGNLVRTPGFTQGLAPEDYLDAMCSAVVAPCPSGPETPDTFRLYEALEAGCVPLADTRTPKEDFGQNFWDLYFGEEVPFPVITDTSDIPDQIRSVVVEEGLAKRNQVFAWWKAQKRKLAMNLISDLSSLGAPLVNEDPRDLITVLVPSSPIPSHPDTGMLEETLGTIRAHLPRSEVLILLDGVREEQSESQEAYERYKEQVIWKSHHEWRNVLPVVFPEHLHQNGTAMEALNRWVRTPLVLYVEHDAPLTPDCPIDWAGAVGAIQSGAADVIRFHHEALVLPDHEHLMIGEVQAVNGVPLRRTAQWSQRPHLASAAFYERMLSTYFSPSAKTMIEDVMHGRLQSICEVEGWDRFKLWMYHPEGNLKRSYHLDGRESDPKFDMIF